MTWDGSIVFLGVTDLTKVKDFYGGLLELQLFKDQGLCLIYEVPGGGMIGFCSHMQVLNAAKSPIITLLTDQVDQVYERMVDAGVHATKPEWNEKFRIYHFFVEDPHGYAVEVQRFGV